MNGKENISSQLFIIIFGIISIVFWVSFINVPSAKENATYILLSVGMITFAVLCIIIGIVRVL